MALNRVIGNSASQILGQLNANGQIFLVNTNGILFGPNSQVNVGALAASTLALSTGISWADAITAMPPRASPPRSSTRAA